MTQKKYPAYKPSGIEWIGEIPSHWNIHRLKQLADKGDSTFIDGDWIESKNITTSGIRYITTGNIGSGKYREQGTSYISEETFKELRCTELFPGDMVLSRLFSPIGRSCILPDLGVRVVTSVDNVIFRPNNDCHKPYLNYYFNWIRYNESNDLMSRGTTLERISRTMLGNNPVLLPPLPEQQAIASYLDKKTALIDSTIRQKERLVELLQEERTAIINQAVTRGLDPNVKMKDSGVEWLGQIPQHWEVKKIKLLSEQITNGFVGPTRDILKESGVRYIQSLHIKQERIDFNTPYYVSEEWSLCHERSILREGDILMVQTGAVGSVAKVTKEFVGCNCHALIILRLNPQKAVTDFYLSYLSSSFGQGQLETIQTGALHPHLNSTKVSEVFVPVPPKNEQKVISEFIEKKKQEINDAIKRQSSQLLLLSEYRTSLINEVVTGKRCVLEESVSELLP